MADYITQLKTWGATGTEFPTGYSYLEGEQPVDAWDNFYKYQSIEDIQHLVELTNDRVESDKGTTHPSSPDSSHLNYRTDKERLFAYDSTNSAWHGLVKIDGDTMQGALDMGGYELSGVGSLRLAGNADLSGNDLNDSAGGVTLYDSASAHIPLPALEASDVGVTAGAHLSGGGTMSLGGTITLDVDDDFIQNTGDTFTGEVTGERAQGNRVLSTKDTDTGDKLSLRVGGSGGFQLVGYDAGAGAWEYSNALTYQPGSGLWEFKSLPSVNGNNVATQSWVNASADVPNADYADSAGDANTLDGQDSSAFADSGHLHDDRYFTEDELTGEYFQESDNGTIVAGDMSFIGVVHVADGETLQVDHAAMIDQSVGPAASGVDLILATGSESKATVLSGDGTTTYDDEQPDHTYKNTTGSGETIVIAIDNGHYNAGSGAEQAVHGSFTARTY